MADIKTRNIRIANNQGAAESGALTVNVYSNAERVKRAAKILGICWGLAVVTLFIPLAHFILVPSFLLAGPIMAYMKYRVVESVEGAQGLLPAVQRPHPARRGPRRQPVSEQRR